jgi:hypothetical protein
LFSFFLSSLQAMRRLVAPHTLHSFPFPSLSLPTIFSPFLFLPPSNPPFSFPPFSPSNFLLERKKNHPSQYTLSTTLVSSALNASTAHFGLDYPHNHIPGPMNRYYLSQIAY